MKCLNLFLFSAILALFSGCSYNNQTEIKHRFPEQRWDRFEKVELKHQVTFTDAEYEVWLKIKHNEQYPYDNLYLNLVIYMPSGEERIKDYNFYLKDEKKDFIGDKKDEYYEVLLPLRKGFRFNNTGVCIFEFENLIPRMEIPGIIEMNVILIETDQK